MQSDWDLGSIRQESFFRLFCVSRLVAARYSLHNLCDISLQGFHIQRRTVLSVTKHSATLCRVTEPYTINNTGISLIYFFAIIRLCCWWLLPNSNRCDLSLASKTFIFPTSNILRCDLFQCVFFCFAPSSNETSSRSRLSRFSSVSEL